MATETTAYDVQFYGLVMSLQSAVMQQLGKQISPFSGKTERNLEAARQSIDLLEMLQRKTSGNLSPEEERFLSHVLYDLRLNYVDESKRKGSVGPSTVDGVNAEGGGEAV